MIRGYTERSIGARVRYGTQDSGNGHRDNDDGDDMGFFSWGQPEIRSGIPNCKISDKKV